MNMIYLLTHFLVLTSPAPNELAKKDDEIHRANVATTDIGVHSNVQEIQLNNFTFAESEIMFILSNFTSVTSSSVISAAHTTLPVLDLCSSQVL